MSVSSYYDAPKVQQKKWQNCQKPYGLYSVVLARYRTNYIPENQRSAAFKLILVYLTFRKINVRSKSIFDKPIK